MMNSHGLRTKDSLLPVLKASAGSEEIKMNMPAFGAEAALALAHYTQVEGDQMNMPGFAAEAALNTRGACQQTARNRGPEDLGKVVPAALKGSVRFDVDTGKVCLIKYCFFEWYDGPPYTSWKCYTENICAHP
jgi:hypothetical protein